MTLIIPSRRPEMSLTKLMVLMLKYVYEEQNMRSEEVVSMQKGVVAWGKYFEDKKDMGKCNTCNGSGAVLLNECSACQGKGYIFTAVEDELLLRLEEIAVMYKLNEEGHFEKRKRMFKEHDIDYRKFHRLPGAVTEQDRARAQKNFEKTKKENPQDYE